MAPAFMVIQFGDLKIQNIKFAHLQVYYMLQRYFLEAKIIYLTYLDIILKQH